MILRCSCPWCRHEPDDIKVMLNLRTTTSAPTFSYTGQNQDTNPHPFYIEIHASIKHSIRPELPVTLATWRTPLERRLQSAHEEDPTSPVWLNSALAPIRSTTDSNKIAGPQEMAWRVHRAGGFPRNLRDAWDFITIPPPAAAASQPASETTVRHLLPTEGLSFRNREGQHLSPGKGETFVVGPSLGALGTFWWRFGDLESDLKDVKFVADDWWDVEGEGGKAPANDEGQCLESQGPNGFGLTMEVENTAEFEICR